MGAFFTFIPRITALTVEAITLLVMRVRVRVRDRVRVRVRVRTVEAITLLVIRPIAQEKPTAPDTAETVEVVGYASMRI